MHKIDANEKKSSEEIQSCGKNHANKWKYKVYKTYWVACTLKLSEKHRNIFLVCDSITYFMSSYGAITGFNK